MARLSICLSKALLLLAVALLPGNPNPLAAQDGSPFLAVFRTDGRAFPIAKYQDGRWSKVWTEPVSIGQPVPPAVDDVPLTWLRYSVGAAPEPVHLRELVLDTMYCCENWGFATDWPGQVPERTSFPKPVNAILLSSSPDVIPADSVPRLQELREQYGLIDNPVDGESRREFVPLSYFRLGDRITVVILHLGWEGESYRLFEYVDGGWREALRVYGGGC